MPGDKIYLCSSGSREGPYIIESTKDGKYTLCDDNANSVKDGETFEERDLLLYDLFEILQNVTAK